MAGYKIPHQPVGTRVSWWADPRGPDHGTHQWGTILEHFGDTVSITWDDDEAFYETWDAREMRYRIDRGQMRLRQPPKQRRVRLPADQVCCKLCGKPRQLKCNCPRPGALKPEEWGQKVDRRLLTPSTSDDMMDLSIGGNAPDEVKGAMMARKKAEVIDEVYDQVDEVEEMTELDAEVEDAGDEGEMLTAKQAASMLKTDGRTLRKFLRKKHGTVGQGQRWAISAGDIEALKAEFAAHQRSEGPKAAADKAPAKPKKASKPKEVEAEADDDLAELEEIDDLDFDD